MEADMDVVSFDSSLYTPSFFEELDAVDSMYYLPAEDSRDSGLDGANPRSTRAAKNIILERGRRKKLNEKLCSLRGVVPSITKMDKASLIQDAIAYIQELQEQEQHILAELESAGIKAEVEGEGFPPRKKMPRTASSINGAIFSRDNQPIQILELELVEVGVNLAMVRVRHVKTRDAMMHVCRALDSLCLEVITTSITTLVCCIIHTMFVEIDEWEREKKRMFHVMGFSSGTPVAPIVKKHKAEQDSQFDVRVEVESHFYEEVEGKS